MLAIDLAGLVRDSHRCRVRTGARKDTSACSVRKQDAELAGQTEGPKPYAKVWLPRRLVGTLAPRTPT